MARAPSRADSGNEKDEPTEGATTVRRKAKTIEEPSRVRCYVHRCNGRCSLGGDAGSNAAKLRGDTLTLLRSSTCTSVVDHTTRSLSRADLSNSRPCFELLRLMLRWERERMVAKRGLRLDPLFLLNLLNLLFLLLHLH